MGRRPRILVAGGIYHVYNRVSRGAQVFRDDEEADRLERLLAATKERDDFQILAWCVMSNHYHLAVRMGEVALSRSMRTIHHRFSQSYNGRHRVFGPFWQGRYRSKYVDDKDYLRQLIAYIHLNPVTGKVVDDPGRYPYSGHRELIRKTLGPLIHVDLTLSIYGDTVRTSRRHYVRALKGTRDAKWGLEMPGRLPWWKGETDRPLEEVEPSAWIDERGVSSGRSRPPMKAEDFVEAASRVLDVDVAELQRKGYPRDTSRARILLAAVGVERWHQGPRDLGRLLGRRADVVSRWVRWGATRREEDPEFAAHYDDLDRRLSDAAGE